MARRCTTLSLPDFDVVVSYRFLLFVIWVVFNESLQCIIHGMLLRKKTIVQWRDLLVDSSVNRGCYKNVSDGIVKTSIVRHLVLLLSLLCVLLLSHFVAGNKVHGWIFKFHSVLWFIVCMLCLLLVHVYYSVGFKRLLELVL
jgi:hypothetical protein